MMDARLAVRFARDSWRGITRRQMLATFLLAVALFIYHFASGLATDDDPFEWTPVLVIFVGDQIKVWPLLLAFSVVEHIGAQDEDRRVAYAMAALLGTLVAAPLAVIFVSAMFNLFVHPARPRVGFMIYIGLETAMFGAAILWIINDRRRPLRARARMHRAELERIAAEKRSIESDLQAMQARVEPQFLFNTLARVRTLYEQDGTRGEHMLDELIAYLRAAMPRMRDTSSTVHQEIDLVRAYLAIVKVRMDERFTYDIDVPPQSYGVRMPPMMLLPLVDDAVGRDADDASAPRAIRIVIEAGASQLTARVTERGRRAPPAHRHALDAIRERLDALYGGAAKVAYRPAGEHAAQVIIEIPIETPVTAARLVTLRGTDAATGPPSARPAPL